MLFHSSRVLVTPCTLCRSVSTCSSPSAWECSQDVLLPGEERSKAEILIQPQAQGPMFSSVDDFRYSTRKNHHLGATSVLGQMAWRDDDGGDINYHGKPLF
ncbi:hypothetical protein V2G26_001313 [Clonostachys chloroleuca]